MAVAYTRHMRQTATYWPPGVNDGYGGLTYGAPEARACRWQNKAVLFRDAQGREVMSESIVYVAEAVEMAGKLLLGVSTADEPPEAAKEIRQLDRSPDLRNARELHKVYL